MSTPEQHYRDPQLRRLERVQLTALALGIPTSAAILAGAIAGALGWW